MEDHEKRYSYDLVQKLTFFVVSSELIICGYILLNQEKFQKAFLLNYIFLFFGISGFCGIVWRFLYNTIIHNSSHEIKTKNIILYINNIIYNLYILFSLSSYILALVVGFKYLS